MSQLATRFSKNRNEYRDNRGLSEDVMRSIAPSIFAEGAHESRSSRYAYIPTIDVLRGLKKEGFTPTMVGQAIARIPGKTDYTKHMVRLRHIGEVGAQTETANEVILVNSHDGTSAYQMLAGVFRFVCMNGLIAGDIVEDIRIKHSGKVAGEVIDAAFRVVDNFAKVDESRELMQDVRLSIDEQRAFANSAALLRFGEQGDTGVAAAPFDAAKLLAPRRVEDNGSDLWRTFQRVQENALRGGQHGRSASGRSIATRPVQAIDKNVSLNRALWTLAESMRQLKAA